jgi:hypothetical protein
MDQREALCGFGIIGKWWSSHVYVVMLVLSFECTSEDSKTNIRNLEVAGVAKGGSTPCGRAEVSLAWRCDFSSIVTRLSLNPRRQAPVKNLMQRRSLRSDAAADGWGQPYEGAMSLMVDGHHNSALHVACLCQQYVVAITVDCVDYRARKPCCSFFCMVVNYNRYLGSLNHCDELLPQH